MQDSDSRNPRVPWQCHVRRGEGGYSSSSPSHTDLWNNMQRKERWAGAARHTPPEETYDDESMLVGDAHEYLMVMCMLVVVCPMFYFGVTSKDPCIGRH
jgi:hypothetical protein